MTRTSFTWVVAVGLFFGIAATTTDVSRGAADEKKATPKGGTSRNEKLIKLMKERLEAAKEEWGSRWREFEAGRGTLDFLTGSSLRLLHAQEELSDNRTGKAVALQEHIRRMKEIEGIQQVRFNAGRIPVKDLAQTKYYRLDAEIMLERLKNPDR